MSSDHFLGDNEQRVMPFYLICDVSLSMRNEMKALHDGFTRLWDRIVSQPIADEQTLVCVMTFSTDAKVLVPLTQMTELKSMPEFVPENGETHYGAAFRALAAEMVADYDALRRAGYIAYRPCAYFLTGGEPTDRDWYQTFNETLTEGPMARMGMPYPIFVPFGFREAKVNTLMRLAYPEGNQNWYHASNATIEYALDSLLGIITNSVVLSRQSMRSDAPHVFPVPEEGSGVTSNDAW